jgi:hypothetical protein
MFRITKTIALVMMSFFALSSPSYLYAVPPDPGWGTSKNCTADTRDAVTTTCCWRERIPGSMLGQRYCQTCTYTENAGSTECGPKVKQMGISDDINPYVPPTDGVSDDPKAGDDPNPGIPPTDGVSDDPKAGDDPNPGISPTEGVTAEAENDKSGSETENADTATDTIPGKGDNGLDTSKLN